MKETWEKLNEMVYIDRRNDISEVSVEMMLDGRFVCHLPTRFNENIAKGFINYISQNEWQHNWQRKLHYRNGDYITIFYVCGRRSWGQKSYKIRYPIHIEIDNDSKEPVATIKNEQIILQCQDCILEQQRNELITKAVDDFRKGISRALTRRKRQGPSPEQLQYVVERFNYYANLYSEENVQLQIIKGLLSKENCLARCCVKERIIKIDYGTIAISPKPQIDNLLIHELTHLQVPNHGKRFLHLMDLRLPKWKEIDILFGDKLYLYQMLSSNSQ